MVQIHLKADIYMQKIANISKTVEKRLGSSGTPIGNGIWRIEWARG